MRAVLFAEQIPISDAARHMPDVLSPLEHALGDGEDFELAFAVSPAEGERLLKAQPVPGITLTLIGAFVAEVGLFVEEMGARRRVEPRGYVHAFGEPLTRKRPVALFINYAKPCGWRRKVWKKPLWRREFFREFADDFSRC